MALASTDLLAPTGDLEPALFPLDDSAALTARLEAYLADGEVRAAGVSEPQAHDDAVRAWAYHRSYSAIYLRLTTTPATQQLNDQGMTSMLVTQIQNVADLAAQWKAAFEAAVATTPAPQPQGSKSVRTGFTW